MHKDKQRETRCQRHATTNYLSLVLLHMCCLSLVEEDMVSHTHSLSLCLFLSLSLTHTHMTDLEEDTAQDGGLRLNCH